MSEMTTSEASAFPYIIYSASRRPEDELEAPRRGAVAIKNSPSRLLELVIEIVRKTEPARKATSSPK
jgi:hypothetical protein